MVREEKIPVPYHRYLSCAKQGETFRDMLQRMDKDLRDRSALADALGVSRRQIYRLLVEYRISEYAPRPAPAR